MFNNDTPGYKKWAITQMINELTKKLKRLVEGSQEWTDTYLRLDRLKKDRDN